MTPRVAPPKASVDDWFRRADGQKALEIMTKILRPPIPFYKFVEHVMHFECEVWEKHLCDRLERLTHEKGQRILVHKPPRTGGSTIVSECFPAYLLGRNPRHTFREITHNQEHSEEFSETVQALIRGDEFKEIFPNTQLPKQTNMREWNTTVRESERRFASQQSYVAMGVMGGTVGKGGDTWLVDDPYGNDKDANSGAYNTDLQRWHRKVLLQRLEPDSNLVVLFHRFEANDYAGWLQKEPGTSGSAKPWEVIRYSALADEVDPVTGVDFLGRKYDEPLAPKRFPWEFLDALRTADPNSFYGLQQGLPQNPAGEVIRRDWFQFQGDEDREHVDGRFIPAFNPKNALGTVIYFDVGAYAGRDETVGTLDCLMNDLTWTWLWQMFGQWAPDERDNQMIEFCLKVMRAGLHPVVYLEEGIGLGKESVDRIKLKMRARGINAETLRSKGTKWERANDRQDSFRSVAEAGRIRLYDGDYLAQIGLNDAKRLCWEPYLQEVTALRLKEVNGVQKLIGKDNKWDSGTGAHNATLKLSKRSISFGDLQSFARRYG